jgi:hypothetical protein
MLRPLHLWDFLKFNIDQYNFSLMKDINAFL